MRRSPLLSVTFLANAALLCAGCELPHGPLRWDPVHFNILPRGELHAPGPFQLTDDCEEPCPRECASEPQPVKGSAPQESAPRSPRLTHHHEAVPLAGPGVNAPWPKFHPVPTRPVFEPQCLVPVPEMSQQGSGVVQLNNQAASE